MEVVKGVVMVVVLLELVVVVTVDSPRLICMTGSYPAVMPHQ
jgi:hypothetical protein